MTEFTPFLKTLSNDPEVIQLLDHSLGVILVRGGHTMSAVPPDIFDMAQHVADWITVALKENAIWLTRVNSDNVPLKLAKCHTLAMLAHEADKAMRIALQKNAYAAPGFGEEEVVAFLDGGYTLVRLMTSAALKNEGLMMQHCIGLGAYDDALTQDGAEFLSLRDRMGKAHVTVEVIDGTIRQLKGKQNRCPQSQYLDLVLAGLRMRGILVHPETSIDGVVASVEGEPFNIYTLPASFRAQKIYTFKLFDLTAIPEDLSVEGSLCLDNTGLTRVPDNLNVGRGLSLERVRSLREIGNGVRIGGMLHLGGCHALTRLPADLHVAEGLYTTWHDMFGEPQEEDEFCESLVEIPGSIYVGGDLDLSGCTNLRDLSPELKIHSSLNVKGTKIEHLPETLIVPGNLTLGGGNLRSLPKTLYVGGHVWVDLHAFGLLLQAIDSRHDLNIGGSVVVNGQPVSVNLCKYPDDNPDFMEWIDDGKYYFYDPPADETPPEPRYTKMPPFKRDWWA